MEKDINRILKQYWGFDSFRSLQEDIIRAVLSGKDTLALMPTGGGKSITYQVPAMVMEGVCLVITPLIALMKDQVEELRKRDIPAEAIYTGMSSTQIETSINKAIGGRVKFLYISPERLASAYFREHLRHFRLSMLAIDEAHCISQWGYDFRPSYLKIAEIREKFPEIPVLALTATATPKVAEDIQYHLKFKTNHVLAKSFRRENISYVVRKTHDKLSELLHILSHLKASAIVYVRKRKTTEELARFLETNGIGAAFYHAGLPALIREKKQEDWKNNVVPVMVATNAFGMGIDKPDVRIVVHYDIPDSPEAYFQEAGRAGRDGIKAYAVLLYNEASLTALKKRIVQSFPDKKYVAGIYQHLGDFFNLGEGEGSGMAFEFDPDRFIKTYQLERITTLSAIRILQVAGYLECTTECRARSRIVFLVSREQLDHIRFDHAFDEQLVVFILRNFPGVFTQAVYVEEDFLADRLESDRKRIYETLLVLSKRRILRYVPGNDRPYIVYYQPRVPASYLHIGRESYEDRKVSYASKVEAMVGYVETDVCRQLYLMRYFGQPEKEVCGVCDYCLGKKKHISPQEKKNIREVVLRLLAERDFEIKDLVRQFDGNRETAIRQIRLLVDEGTIYYKSATLLALKIRPKGKMF